MDVRSDWALGGNAADADVAEVRVDAQVGRKSCSLRGRRSVGRIGLDPPDGRPPESP